jgi:putative DNA primase/helicase
MVAGDPGVLCASLLSDGLVIERIYFLHFASYLNRVRVKSRVITVDRTGWHNIKGRWHFVLPKETIGPSDGERVILKEAGVDYYEKRGTLTDWQAGIGTMSKGEGSLILNLSSALVASLARITGINASGLNIVDDTSKGKSTCQYAGATVWGRGGKGGFVQPWNATINGIEAVAVLFNDTLLSLDDMKQAAPQVVSEALYMIHNGVGRVRMDRTRALQETNKWSTFVMSSSEQSEGRAGRSPVRDTGGPRAWCRRFR